MQTFSALKKPIFIMIALYVAVFGTMTALRHYNFETQAYDMGIFTQLFWSSTQGDIMRGTLEEIPNHLGIHWSPFLLLLVPFYTLYPSPYTLLILQTLALALGAWAVYLIAKKFLGSETWGNIFAGAYLLYPSLHWINWYDFHEIAFLPTLLLWSFYFFISGKRAAAFIFLALAAGIKEDAILAVFFMGVYLVFYSRKKEFLDNKMLLSGLAIGVIALVYFILTVKIFMPTAGGGLLRLDRYSNFGGSGTEIVKNIFSHPALIFSTIFVAPKMAYLFWIFLPVAFLPFFAPTSFILLFPGLFENLLTDYSPQTTGLYQYDGMIIAGIFIGSIMGVKYALDKFGREKIMKIILITAAIATYAIRSPLNPFFFPTQLFYRDPRLAELDKIIKNISAKKTVTANTNIVPHLANREKIYLLGHEPKPADVAIIDAADMFGFKNQAAFETYANQYLQSDGYEITAIGNRYIIAEKK